MFSFYSVSRARSLGAAITAAGFTVLSGFASSAHAGSVDTAIAYARSVVGAPYGWWTGGAIPEGPPMYHKDGAPPNASYVINNGVNCSGLTNLMRRAAGLSSIGGTGAYGQLPNRRAFSLQQFPKGTLIGRYYRDVNDQGHVAVVTDNNYVIQSYADCSGCTTPGANEWWTVAESHAGYYYEYYILPGDWLPTVSAPAIIVDNTQAGFSASSNWTAANSAADKYGTNYRYRPTAPSSDAAQWSFNVPAARSYALYAWWTAGPNRAAAAPYILPDGTTVNKNQQANGGGWRLLATKPLSAGTNTVKLSCWTTSGYVVVADAIRAVPQ